MNTNTGTEGNTAPQAAPEHSIFAGMKKGRDPRVVRKDGTIRTLEGLGRYFRMTGPSMNLKMKRYGPIPYVEDTSEECAYMSRKPRIYKVVDVEAWVEQHGLHNISEFADVLRAAKYAKRQKLKREKDAKAKVRAKARQEAAAKTKPKAVPMSADGRVYVKGFHKKNGTWVAPCFRSERSDSRRNRGVPVVDTRKNHHKGSSRKAKPSLLMRFINAVFGG